MSTRSYTLTFTGPGTQQLPQGRFFMIKAATAALNIEARKRDSQPTTFENVGAGLKYNALEASKWYELHVTSNVAQVVEIVISDEAEVDFSNAVSVTGVAVIQEQPSASFNTPAAVSVNASASGNIAANPARLRVTICNPSTNTGSFWLMDANNAPPRGIELQPGTFVELKTTAQIFVRNDAGVAQSFTYFEE